VEKKPKTKDQARWRLAVLFTTVFFYCDYFFETELLRYYILENRLY